MSVEELMKNLPVIETERVLLRKVSEEDVADIFEYASNPNVARYASWSNHNTLEDSKRVVDYYVNAYKSHSCLIWGVVNKSDNKLIGTAGYVNINQNSCRGEIGYTLNEAFWGKGYASEIARKLVDFGFSSMHLHRIEGICHVDNHPSVRVMEKVGMEFEGILRGYNKKEDNFYDVKLYAILKEIE
ncbi:GNAT family N-acetyltransferase [Vallitalea okinawensis]|uniref:GNAT family N-acetyltransferase n=1 Tax=Vallitalea okinawensis TaxID=2078660 RepID=UPI000CFAA7ED|nr:GNAT family N-acetyltransferase [Vallitalea okinawensis]